MNNTNIEGALHILAILPPVSVMCSWKVCSCGVGRLLVS
jgi:hypothetical protein